MNRDADSVAIRVMGRYFMNSPMMPGQKSSGMKAASVVAVAATIGHAMRFAAIAYACRRGYPSAMRRSASSTTTIVPSTSMPTAMMSENSTTMLIVSPAKPSTRMPVRKEPGMETPTRPAVRSPSAATTTIITSTIAAMTLLWRSRSMSRMSSDLSCENRT